jgi:hypothetical protein
VTLRSLLHAYDPAVLVAVLLYAYCTAITRSTADRADAA